MRPNGTSFGLYWRRKLMIKETERLILRPWREEDAEAEKVLRKLY